MRDAIDVFRADFVPLIKDATAAFAKFLKANKSEIIETLADAFKSVASRLRETAPVLLAVSSAFGSLVVPVLKFLAAHPALLEAIALLKGAQMIAAMTQVTALGGAFKGLATSVGLANAAMLGIGFAAIAASFIIIRDAVKKTNAEFQKSLDQVEKMQQLARAGVSEDVAEAAEEEDPEKRLALLREQEKIVKQRFKTAVGQKGDDQRELARLEKSEEEENFIKGAIRASAGFVFGADQKEGFKKNVESSERAVSAARDDLKDIEKLIKEAEKDLEESRQPVGSIDDPVDAPDPPSGPAKKDVSKKSDVVKAARDEVSGIVASREKSIGFAGVRELSQQIQASVGQTKEQMEARKTAMNTASIAESSQTTADAISQIAKRGPNAVYA